MSDYAFTRTMFLLLLLCAALLSWRDWQLQGEIENLHARIDLIDLRPVARILRAHDDATAEAVAREGT